MDKNGINTLARQISRPELVRMLKRSGFVSRSGGKHEIFVKDGISIPVPWTDGKRVNSRIAAKILHRIHSIDDTGEDEDQEDDLHIKICDDQHSIEVSERVMDVSIEPKEADDMATTAVINPPAESTQTYAAKKVCMYACVAGVNPSSHDGYETILALPDNVWGDSVEEARILASIYYKTTVNKEYRRFSHIKKDEGILYWLRHNIWTVIDPSVEDASVANVITDVLGYDPAIMDISIREYVANFKEAYNSLVKANIKLADDLSIAHAELDALKLKCRDADTITVVESNNIDIPIEIIESILSELNTPIAVAFRGDEVTKADVISMIISWGIEKAMEKLT